MTCGGWSSAPPPKALRPALAEMSAEGEISARPHEISEELTRSRPDQVFSAQIRRRSGERDRKRESERERARGDDFREEENWGCLGPGQHRGHAGGGVLSRRCCRPRPLSGYSGSHRSRLVPHPGTRWRVVRLSLWR